LEKTDDKGKKDEKNEKYPTENIIKSVKTCYLRLIFFDTNKYTII